MTSSASIPWTLTKAPRAWQTTALNAWLPSFTGIASVVTGGGKTMFAEMCMQAFRARHLNGRFVIVVPTLALLDQWYVSLREDLRVPDNSISIYSGDSQPREPNTVNLMVMNTARACAPPLFSIGPTMLIVDECHRAASASNARALTGSPTATLGISATPEREYDDLFTTVLVPALGPVIFRYDYNQALKDGAIVPFDLVNVYADMAPAEQERYDRLTRDVARTFCRYQRGDVGRDVLDSKLRRRARLSATSLRRIPVTVRLAEQARGSRTIVFHENIDAAESILRILLARNFNATIYHSRIAPQMRRDNLRLYRQAVFEVLVTCRALDEGVNVPETTVAIVAASTSSLRQRIQRLGRVLRPARDKERARIYTIYMTKVEEERLLREVDGLVDTQSVVWMRSSFGDDHATPA